MRALLALASNHTLGFVRGASPMVVVSSGTKPGSIDVVWAPGQRLRRWWACIVVHARQCDTRVTAGVSCVAARRCPRGARAGAVISLGLRGVAGHPLFARRVTRVAGVRGGVGLYTTGRKDPGLAVARRGARDGQSRVRGGRLPQWRPPWKGAACSSMAPSRTAASEKFL